MDRSSLVLAVLLVSCAPLTAAAQATFQSPFTAPNLREEVVQPPIHLDRLGKDSFVDARARAEFERGRENAALMRAAGEIVQLIDARRTDEVAEGAFAGEAGNAGFAREVDSLRAQAGELVDRGDARLAKIGAGAEAGVVEVTFPARFANMEGAVNEKLAFRLGDDKTWRVTGYNLAFAGR